MTSVAFCVPAHGRFDLTRVCLRQLRRTCDVLESNGLRASAIVVADDENLDTAADLGFGTVRRENKPLGRRWNDSFQVATDPAVNPHPFTHVIPCGSDDWVDPAFILAGGLPSPNQMRCARMSAIVREDGERLARLRIPYPAGDGVRIFPASMFEPFGYRPAAEDASRALDTSVWSRLKSRGDAPELVYFDLHPLQIVDWKSPAGQLNPYGDCQGFRVGVELDPWEALADVYPAEALDEMRAVYAEGLVAA